MKILKETLQYFENILKFYLNFHENLEKNLENFSRNINGTLQTFENFLELGSYFYLKANFNNNNNNCELGWLFEMINNSKRI